MRRTRTYRSAGLLRSVTLLWSFLVASAAILAIGAFTLSSILSSGLRDQALADNARDITILADAAVATRLVKGNGLAGGPAVLKRRMRAVRMPIEVRAFDVWTREGKLVYSARSPKRVGTRVKSLGPIRSVARTKQPVTRMVDLTRTQESVVKVWTPLNTNLGRPVAVAEVTLDERILDEAVAKWRSAVWVAVLLVFGALWLAIAILVRSASVRLYNQNDALQVRSRELTEVAQQLEQTLLETIETLNAAVEARDPYTAGHSQRVRKVALAIGRELGLDAHRLGTLSTSALFHDVGKIGIPDSILTKAGPLSPSEAAVMREHVTRGAEIVSRITSLQEAVPAIRHHHERWDGLGYPEGLSGEEIPLEAAIIGLADAWDAMTTDRPYAVALDLNDAMMQIRAGRTKQFSPAVVDAFWAVAKRRPSDILPPEAPTAVLAAV